MTTNRRPNIVWLTLDSVRTDRTSLAGYHRDTTPQMQRIADDADGQAFTDCVSHAMWSLPSDSSILTGTYPAHHGTGLWNDVLPPDITTVPERFSELGYRTVGISQNAYCSDSTGLSRGFDEFTWMHKSNLLQTAGPRILLRYLLGLRKHSAGYTTTPSRHRPEFIATEVAKRQLSSYAGGDDPFFMFVHTQGAHLPYIPPLPYRDAFTDDIELSTEEAVEVAFDRSMNYYREIANGCEFSAAEKEAIDAMYDGVLAYADQQVGDLFDHVQSLDAGPTIFVVTGDHGDLLGEHGVIGHQFSLHDGLVNVPTVVHGLPSATDLPSDSLVQHIDVMQMLLAEAGASDSALDELQGIDPREEERTYALSQRGNETYETAVEQVRTHNPDADLGRFQSGLLHAVRSDEYKWLRGDRGDELYRLDDEDTDVSAAHPSVAEEHRAFFEAFSERLGRGRRNTEKREMSSAMKKQLSDLGYVMD
nr:sulfatase [Halogeometricum rufum]